MSIGFEVLPTNTSELSNHPMMKKQIQRLRLKQQDQVYETTEVTIKGADGGLFALMFAKPDLSLFQVPSINTDSTAAEMESKLKPFYGGIKVTLLVICKNAAEAEVDCANSITSTLTTVQLTDATTVNGVTWTDLRNTAMMTGYDSSALPSQADKDLVAGLIAAQTGQGYTYVLQSTLVTVQLTDSTTVAGTTWANLKEAAMVAGYTTSGFTAED